ncbi:MAG: hypothetical protein HZA53_05410 [Planctomycetes bacterium]|nr:hypothetical protein [Planctomycetota bacterium]
MKPSMQSTWTFVCLSFFAMAAAPAFVSGAAPLFATQAAQEQPAEARYVRVKDAGAKLLNLADKDADPLSKAAAGTVLQVHGESAGFLEVSSPAGVEVWIYGEYAKESKDSGMLEITANSVRMRPQPSAGEKSYALRQTLTKGDRVRFVARHDAKKAMAEDWIKIVSPTSAHAWVAAGDTLALAAGEDGKVLFAAAERELAAQAAVVALPKTESAAKPAAKADVKAQPAAATSGDALGNAEKLMQAALASEKPDFTAAKAAYKKELEAHPTGPAAENARKRLEEIAAREEIAAMRAEGHAKTEAQKEELEKKAAELREASLSQDPLWGRFQKRGWLEQDGDRYVIRWANKLTAEVVCSQKRYDLARFVGYEIGVTGITTRSAGASGQPEKVDLSRIEVLSGAGTKR